MQVTTDAGKLDKAAWTNVTKAPLPNRFVTDIGLDPNEQRRAIVTYSGFNANTPNTPGKVFLTNDQGGTWTDISGAVDATLSIPADQSFVGKEVRAVATTTDALGGTTVFTGTGQTIANVDDAATGTLAVTGTARPSSTPPPMPARKLPSDRFRNAFTSSPER